MAPKRRSPTSTAGATVPTGQPIGEHGNAVSFGNCDYMSLQDMRPFLKDKMNIGRFVHYTVPKPSERPGCSTWMMSFTLKDSSGDITVVMYEEHFPRFLTLVSEYDSILRCANLSFCRGSNREECWARVTSQTLIERVPDTFVYD